MTVTFLRAISPYSILNQMSGDEHEKAEQILMRLDIRNILPVLSDEELGEFQNEVEILPPRGCVFEELSDKELLYLCKGRKSRNHKGKYKVIKYEIKKGPITLQEEREITRLLQGIKQIENRMQEEELILNMLMEIEKEEDINALMKCIIDEVNRVIPEFSL